MRKRKLYLSEIVERYYETENVPVNIYFPRLETIVYRNFREVKEKLKDAIYVWEVKKWTYSKIIGYIIIIK